MTYLVQVRKEGGGALGGSMAKHLESLAVIASGLMEKAGGVAVLSMSLEGKTGNEVLYSINSPFISPDRAQALLERYLPGADNVAAFQDGQTMLVERVFSFPLPDGSFLELRLLAASEIGAGLVNSLQSAVERYSGQHSFQARGHDADIAASPSEDTIMQKVGAANAAVSQAPASLTVEEMVNGKAAGPWSHRAVQLLRCLELIGKSADEVTLRFEFISSVKSLIQQSNSFCWWSLAASQGAAELEQCDCLPPRKKGEVISISDDHFFAESIPSRSPVCVEVQSAVDRGSTEGHPAGGTRVLVVLRQNENPSAILEFKVDLPRKMKEEDLLGIEILARSAENKLGLIGALHRLDDERKVSSMLSKYLSGTRQSTVARNGEWNACDLIPEYFPGIEGVVYALRDGAGYRCVLSSFTNGIQIQEGLILGGEISSVIVPDGIVEISAERNHDAWAVIQRLFGASAGSSEGCSILSSHGSTSNSIMLFFGVSRNGRRYEIASSCRPFLYALDSKERGSAAINRQRKAELLSGYLFDRLETMKFTEGQMEIVSSVSGIVSSVTGAELIRFYSYDENEKAFFLLRPDQEMKSSARRNLTLQEYNLIGSSSRSNGTFAVGLENTRRRLWDSLGIDSSFSSARLVGVSKDGVPSMMLLIGFRENKKPEVSDDQTLVRICRMLSNMLAATRFMNDSIGTSNLSYEFLRMFSQSLMSRENRWSMDDAHIANRLCTLVGGSMQEDFVFLFSTLKDGGSTTLLGKWSRTPYEGALLAEVTAFMRTVENREGWTGGRNRLDTVRVDGKHFPLIHGYGISSAAVMSSGDADGPMTTALLLLNSDGRVPQASESQTVSAALDTTRLIFESRNRRSGIDWTISAMRSELGIAKILSSTFDMKSMLNGTVKEVGRFLGCDVCMIELLDDKGSAALAAIANRSAEVVLSDTVEETTQIGTADEPRRGFTSIFSENGNNIYVQGEKGCSDVISLVPREERTLVDKASEGRSMKCIFGTPISFAGKLLGLLVCMRSSLDETFGKTEVAYLESVAALASTAIENSRNMEATFNALSKLKRLDTLRSNFSSIAAHELRTPLTSIRVYIELMKLGKVGRFSELEMKNVENLIASISELTEIINNMLEFTRMEAMLLETEMSLVSLQPVVEEICAQLSPAANAKSIKLEMEAKGIVMKVMANAPLVKRVLNNLVGNAIKFTQEGGSIIVRLKDEREGVLLIVEDTGKGIPAEDLPYIFDRFHVVDSSILHSRTGFRLGLPISKLIVERHGGRIWADSELGKGSKFYVLLPVKQGISTEDWLTAATNYIH